MKIDPYAWLLTAPATIALIQLYFQPADHLVKRLWREFTRCESIVWERIGLASIGQTRERRRAQNLFLFCSITMGLAIASLASLGAFLGVLPTQ